MAFVIPYPIEIICVACTEVMRVEKQVIDTYNDVAIVAVECACGRRIGAVNILRMQVRPQEYQRVSSNQLELFECDAIGERGKELREHAQAMMQRAEDYIGMATWARDGKR